MKKKRKRKLSQAYKIERELFHQSQGELRQSKGKFNTGEFFIQKSATPHLLDMAKLLLEINLYAV